MNMKRWLLVAAVMTVPGLTFGQSQATEMRVTGERGNGRAKPYDKAEVVGQVATNSTVMVIRTDGQWAQIRSPSNISLWVYRDFVTNGLVTAPKLKVRAGPSFLYSDVGVMEKGDKVEVRAERGEWLEIAPPASCALWMSRNYVAPTASTPAPPPSSASPAAPPPSPMEKEPFAAVTPPPVPPPVQTTTPAVAVSKPLPQPPPEDLKKQGLVPLDGQGKTVQLEGELRPAGFLFGPPARYRLVDRQGGVYRTICYVKGNNKQLSGFVGRPLLISGRQYWLQGTREPVVVPDVITPK